MATDDSNTDYFNGSSAFYHRPHGEPHSTGWLATVPLILSIIISLTVVGNMMVIVAYLRDHLIRANVANLFILNLAITDLIVGSFIMTIDTSWIIKDYWTYGEVFCKFWLTVDFVASMMSVVTMVLISWDRYCLLTMGLKYKTFQTKKRIGVILFVAWTFVGIWYSFMTFAWSPITGNYNVDYTDECEMEYTYNIVATLVMNIFEYFIPFTILVVLNIAVYINIRRRSRGTVGQSPPAHVSTRSPQRSYATTSPTRGNYSHSASPTNQATDSHKATASGGADVIESYATTHVDVPMNNDSSTRSRKEGRTFARHRKAAFVLAVLIGCFFLCWVPYQVASIMFAVCGANCISETTWEVTNFLLWSNSTINPFIYAATNVHFRRNFRHFLLLDRWFCDMKTCRLKHQRCNQNQVFNDSVNDSIG